MLNYLRFNYYHIKVVIDEYDYVYIDIYPHYTIKDVKDVINTKQGKITPKFVEVYKGDILLEEDRIVESYNITQKDALNIRTSRKGEFLVYFWCKERTVGKYVKSLDKINEAFNYIKIKFKDYLNENNDVNLVYENEILFERDTFESKNIKKNSKIIVTRQILYG